MKININKLNSMTDEEFLTEIKDKSVSEISNIRKLLDYQRHPLEDLMAIQAGVDFNTLLEALINNTPEEDRNWYCMDNYRFYKVGDPLGKKLFEVSAMEGCCGELYDEVIYQGQKYQIGFNFGH